MDKTKKIFYWFLGFILVLGIGFRTFAFSCRDSFEDDECRLILAFLDKNWIQMFCAIGDAQSAPPLFIIAGRFLGVISGFNERIVKLIPYLCSIASLFVFYKLSERFLVKNYSKLLACFIFAINLKLITFGSIFKQYSSDVLVGILCLLFLPQIDFENLNRKNLILLALTFVILPFISLPVLFFVGAFVIINIKNYKKLIPLFMPFLFAVGIYFFINLLPSKLSVDEIYANYWDEGFLNWKNCLAVLNMNFKYFFYPNICSFFEIILFLSGLYFTAKENTKFNRYILVFWGLVLLAFCLHLYPFAQRVALYSLPVIILLMVKSFDAFKIKSIGFGLVCFCFIAGFWAYGISYFKSLFTEETFINYSPKTLMNVLEKEFNPKTDVVLVNNASVSSFMFYSSKSGFDTDEVYEIPVYGIVEDRVMEDYLNRLDSPKRYWFYLIKDYPQMPRIPAILDWSEKENVIKKYQERKSYLLLVKNCSIDR